MQAWLPGYAGFLTQDLRRCVENRLGGQVPGQVFERKASLRLGQERKKNISGFLSFKRGVKVFLGELLGL
jgi:hypothetical protein